MSMRFGFEHDEFSDDDFEPNVQTEPTSLLATSDAAPTADSKVAEATTSAIGRTELSSVHGNVPESDSTSSFGALLADYLASEANAAQDQSTSSRHGSVSARRDSTCSPQYGSSPAQNTSTSFRHRSILTENRSKRSTPRGSTTPFRSELHQSTSTQCESAPSRFFSITTHSGSDPTQYDSASTQRDPSATATPHQRSTSTAWGTAEPHGLTTSTPQYQTSHTERCGTTFILPHQSSSNAPQPENSAPQSPARDKSASLAPRDLQESTISTRNRNESTISIHDREESSEHQEGKTAARSNCSISNYETTTTTPAQHESQGILISTQDGPKTSVRPKAGLQELSVSIRDETEIWTRGQQGRTSTQRDSQEPITSTRDEPSTSAQNESSPARQDSREALIPTYAGLATTTQHEPSFTYDKLTAPADRNSIPFQDEPREPQRQSEAIPTRDDSLQPILTRPRSTSTQYGLTANQNVSDSGSYEPVSRATVLQQGQRLDKLPLANRLLMLCFDRVIEPIAFLSIFPFINQMIVRVGHVAPSDTGFYIGFMESLFSLTQTFVVILWGRLSDRIGRKPVLVASLLGLGLATLLFGLARTIWEIILFRCLAGSFSGSIFTVRTMISEQPSDETQARAFISFAYFGNLGIFLAPLIGGAFANPNRFITYVFNPVPYFERYPYSLPMFVAGGLAMIAAILTIFLVEETHHLKGTSPSNLDSDSEVTLLLPREGIDAEGGNRTISLPKTMGAVSGSNISGILGLHRIPGSHNLPETLILSSIPETPAVGGLPNIPVAPISHKIPSNPGVPQASCDVNLPGSSDIRRVYQASDDRDLTKPAGIFRFTKRPDTTDLLKTPGVVATLIIYGLCMILGTSYAVVSPVFFFESINVGGYGFDPGFIAIFMAITGAAQGIWLLLIYPPLQRNIGIAGVLRLCAYFWPLFFLCLPLLNTLLRVNTLPSTTIFWTLSPIILSLGIGVNMAFTSVQLLLNDASTDPQVLATLNSMVLALTSALRIIGPIVFGTIYSMGVRHQVVWGYLAWVFMILLAVGLAVAVWRLPKRIEQGHEVIVRDEEGQ